MSQQLAPETSADDKIIDVSEQIYARLPEEVRLRLAERDALPEEEKERLRAEDEERKRARAAEIKRPIFRKGSDVRGAMVDHTFGKFELRGGNLRSCRKIAQSFVSRLPNPPSGVMFWGDAGCGKTYMLEAIINAAIDDLPEPVASIFVACGDMSEEMASWKYVEHLKTFKLIGLDDFDKAVAGKCSSYSYDVVTRLLQWMEREEPDVTLISTCQCPVRTVVIDGESYPGLETAKVKDYILGRAELLFYQQHMFGPNGRAVEYQKNRYYWVD